MSYFRNSNGLGGAKTNDKRYADALLLAADSDFLPCSKEEYEAAMLAANGYLEDDDESEG